MESMERLGRDPFASMARGFGGNGKCRGAGAPASIQEKPETVPTGAPLRSASRGMPACATLGFPEPERVQRVVGCPASGVVAQVASETLRAGKCFAAQHAETQQSAADQTKCRRLGGAADESVNVSLNRRIP